MTLFPALSLLAQGPTLKGRVIDTRSNEPLTNVQLGIEGTNLYAETNAQGLFSFSSPTLPLGEQVLTVELPPYLSQRIPVVLEQTGTVDLDPILLELDLTQLESHIGVINLTDVELNDDEGISDQISGLLHAGKDVFLNAAAYDFSATFFRPRGLDNANGKVLINGLEMNKMATGRPQWGNWGGLNDVQRNRIFSRALSANDHSFGDLGGVTNLVMRASKYRSGGQISVAAANRSYQGRLMATYHSGLSKAGWAYSVSAARRVGEEGYVEGTLYDANSFFISVEKMVSKKSSLNLTAFYTPNFRGRSTAITQEVHDIKGKRYNPNWGYQNGKIRNSRIREIKEPIIQLSHFWDPSDKVTIDTHIGYQFGTIKNSRIDNNGTQLITTQDGQSFFAGGARNVLGNYYQRLPSYFLRNPDPSAYDYQLAFQAAQELRANGQVHWEALYAANTDADGNPKLATYVLQNDVTEDVQISAKGEGNIKFNDKLRLNSGIEYRTLSSENYAEVGDLLGSSGYLDIDSFTEASSGDSGGELQTNRAQSDLRNPNRIAIVNERYKYNYVIDANTVSGFAQIQSSLSRLDFYLALTIGSTSYQRTGLYENGNFPGNLSFGAGEKLSFTTYGFKAGGTYKITGRHLIDATAGYFTKAPTIGRSFSNARQNNESILGIKTITVQNLDLSYIYRTPNVKARLSGYYIAIEDQTDLGFYFTEDISGLGLRQDAFVQEVMTGINTRSVGLELGVEIRITNTFKLKAAGAFGQHTYTNDPNLYLRSDDFETALTFGDGTTKLKNYHVAAGPERAYQFGLEYRDPNYWWVGVTGNYFSNAYIDVNNLSRTANFTSDFDGQPFNDYNEEEARELLRQEEIEPYLLVNMVGGKSWRISKYFVGFFAAVANVLDQEYVTGGFEQGRNANFRRLREDANRPNGPLFGTRYFFGNGTTYYLNLYFRF